jgi:hypothetical protein
MLIVMTSDNSGWRLALLDGDWHFWMATAASGRLS